MAHSSQTPTNLRSEAGFFSTAGMILLGLGFPLTLFLAAMAISPDGLSPAFPIMFGGPPVALGYLACRYASWRLAQAKSLEEEMARARRAKAKAAREARAAARAAKQAASAHAESAPISIETAAKKSAPAKPRAPRASAKTSQRSHKAGLNGALSAGMA